MSDELLFLPVSIKFDPERQTGTITALEAIEGEALGDMSLSFPISEQGRARIMAIINAEIARALGKMKSAAS